MYIYIPCIYEFTYYLYFHYVWIHFFCFYQVIGGAKSDSNEDTNDGDVGLSMSFGSPTESYQVSFHYNTQLYHMNKNYMIKWKTDIELSILSRIRMYSQVYMVYILDLCNLLLKVESCPGNSLTMWIQQISSWHLTCFFICICQNSKTVVPKVKTMNLD